MEACDLSNAALCFFQLTHSQLHPLSQDHELFRAGARLGDFGVKEPVRGLPECVFHLEILLMVSAARGVKR